MGDQGRSLGPVPETFYRLKAGKPAADFFTIVLRLGKTILPTGNVIYRAVKLYRPIDMTK